MIRTRTWVGLGCALALACGASPAAPTAPGGGSVALTTGNPFDGARFYVNPAYGAKVESTATGQPGEVAERVRRAKAFPTAVWLSSISLVRDASRYLDAARGEQDRLRQPVVTVLVLYDLPDRDCAARASAGELPLGDGEARYRTDVVDALAAQLRAHGGQRIALVVEPDSLANIATNLDVGTCRAAEPVYRRSIAYAVRTLSMPNVSIYLDAAHAGWLGWDGNRAKIARVYRDVLDQAGGVGLIRGFSTNVSNFNTLGDADGKRLEPSDPCPDELTYVQKLSASLAEVGIEGKGFLVDTGRNGRGGIRSKWSAWCNVKGAGLGERPHASPAPGVDAYYWVKPPGESDGASDPSSDGFDPMCATPDSAPGAPHAGAWFGAYFVQLVENANPPL
ncbi:MAG: glycoside hydrolase family 6 protein [Polyangiaceae bacterium]